MSSAQKEQNWALNEIETFLIEVSGPDFIELLKKPLNEKETPHLKEIQEILLLHVSRVNRYPCPYACRD